MRHLLIALVLLFTANLMSQNYQAEKEKIEAAMMDGKPRTALKAAEAYYDLAVKSGDEDQAIKALAYRAEFASQTEEEGQDFAIKLIHQELDASTDRPVIAAVLNYMLGSSYYQYAQQNSWRLRNATAVTTDSVPAADRPLEDWNLTQLVEAAEGHLFKSLELARAARTKLSSVPAIVSNDSARIDEQPTLYDLLARNSLSMLGNPLLSVGDPEVANPEQYLGSAAAFAAMPIEVTEGTGTYRKLKIYQDLTNFHLGPPSPALMSVDIDRLEYVMQLGTDNADYLAALRRMQEVYRNTVGGQIFLVKEAQVYANDYRNEEALVDNPKALALSILGRITDKGPAVATPAEQLRRQILTKSLSANVQSVYGKKENILINLSFRNIDRVYHRIYAAPQSGPSQDFERWRINEEALAKLVKQKPITKVDFRLPENDDYEQHTTETWIAAQKPGRYYLVSSSDARFDMQEGYVAITNFQISDLGVARFHDGEDHYFEVVDRTTGAARAGVSVEMQRQNDSDRNKWNTIKTVTTGADGRFENPNIERTSVRFILNDRTNSDVLVTNGGYFRTYHDEGRNTYPLTPLFTDRNIYRPGQTVKVYGLTWQKNPDQMPEMLARQKREFVLHDPNYQDIGRASVVSDEYSRFNLEFKLPEGGLTGNFHIQTEGGSVVFRMEEYKRPRFEVELDGPDYAVAEEETEVKGTAKLYAGPGLDGAKVNYRVFLEEVSYWWWGRGNNNDKELIADGTTETDGQGKFLIRFTPEKQNQKGRKRFRFVIEADVADDTGETHDASTNISLRSEKPVIALRPTEELVDKADSLTILAAGADEDLTVKLTITPVTKPGTSLQDRKWEFPDRPVLTAKDYQKRFPGLAFENSNTLEKWNSTGDPIYQGNLKITKGEARLDLAARNWPVGHYRLDWAYPDGTAGESATFAVIDAEKAVLPAGVNYFTKVSNRNPKVGETFTMTLVSNGSLPNVNALWASRKGFKIIETTSDKKAVFSYTATDADRGGINFSVGFVQFNESHNFRERFNLGWDNKKLKIDYATFRDKLRPGEPERWTLTVKNADGSPVVAAALASMYDASLDQISPNQGWSFSPFPDFNGYIQSMEMLTDGMLGASGRSNFRWPNLPASPQLPRLDLSPFGRFGYENQLRSRTTMHKQSDGVMNYSAPPAAYDDASMEGESLALEEISVVNAGGPPPPPPAVPQAENKAADAPVKIRKKLQETAFWFPDLTSDQDGNLVISFDSPEALTSWKFQLFAHDKELATAVSEQTIVTQKELMVLPNVPRFVREGDEIGLTARVNNMTEVAMDVTVTLELFDPATDQLFSSNVLSSLGAAAGAKKWMKEQSIAPNSGEAVSFALTIPDGFSATGPIGYRIIARAPGFSDGEENVIPVLTDRTLITVSQPFYLKRKEKKTVTLPVLGGNNSTTLQHVNYTFQATTNPAWLALKSLPYLMEYPYDCTEQLANRYFANQLAYATVKDKPILEQVFREWQKDTNALKSELEQNQNLKNALLTETPWLRAAEDESKQRARIGELFDLKRLADEQTAALDKLANRQSQSGYFSWFPGGRENRYMTQYVVETLARLRQLKVVTPDQKGRVTSISESAILWLDQEMKKDYQELLRRMKDEKDWEKNYRPSSSVVHYLYARALSGQAQSSDKDVTTAFNFYTERAAAEWLNYGLYEQALLAATDVTINGLSASKRETQLAVKIIESLREKALHKDEFGMYWKYGRGYNWQNLPIETHCRILEAFQLAGGTTDELDEMRLWLLTNKRTNRWETTKSTAAAVFALLNTGTNWTDGPGKPLEVTWPGFASKADLASRVRAAQETAEAASGAFSVDVAAADITSGLASVKVKNKDNRLVWGGVYWQYTELAEKVETASDGPLTLERELFRRIPTEDGMRLEPITASDPLSPGDRVTVKLTLRSDRELDYVHLKDRRAATFEPIEQLSGYQYKGGLGYYFAPGDLATNFFIDHLPKGTFTVEYDLFATYAGSFSNGLGRVQCMYAPEFGANTNGARIVVE